MSKPKGTISKKVEAKIRAYFEKIANDTKSDSNRVRNNSQQSQAN